MNDLELTQTEAEFFAEGLALEQTDNDTFADLDTDMPRGVWDRMFHKRDAQ